MADEELAIASPALESPASGETQDTPEVETEASEEELDLDVDGLDEEAEDEDPEDELDFGFKQYRVPKSLKKAVEDLRADATRKQQDASARQKALDTKEREIEERQKVSQEELDDRATLKLLDNQLEAYSKLSAEDWAAHRLNDPIGTDNHWTAFQLLKDKKAEVSARLDQRAKERSEAAQSELTKRIQETLEHAKKSKGFTEKTIPQVVEFAQQMGIPDSLIQSNWSPTMFDLLRYARIGKMALDKQAQPKPASKEAPPPTTTVKGNKTVPTRPSDRMSVQNWIELRNKQVSAR
jgi:hypothetical protein